jgi:hypothetical protein
MNKLITMVLDGSEQQCSIPVKRTTSDRFYSGKKSKHTISKLVVASPSNGQILWISKSYQGSCSDLQIAEFKSNHFWEKADKSEHLIADKGFRGFQRLWQNTFLPYQEQDTEEKKKLQY